MTKKYIVFDLQSPNLEDSSQEMTLEEAKDYFVDSFYPEGVFSDDDSIEDIQSEYEEIYKDMNNKTITLEIMDEHLSGIDYSIAETKKEAQELLNLIHG